ncbi:MMPL family transporter [Paractinoplanes ferrugineus]|uniref:Membrane protein n=1 Tax=Paractinoplanes ferrugineus TaxID=113564 RepID=A0A919MDM1_9ACTN|nr:MMPL family transporter [Actinoplanes ferrugineus]GIE10729.1 membrane protein [Actinoplanes ferrugineus]
MFERIARWATRRRWWALTAWVLVLVAVTAAAQAVGARYHNDFSLPGTESQQALEALSAEAPAQAGATVQVVLRSAGGLATQRTRVQPMLAELGALPRVADVRDPFTTPGAVSADGTIGYATVTLDAQAQDVPPEDVRRIIDTARQVAGQDGLQVELGGDPVRGAEETAGGASEGLGLLAALVILVFMFGSLLAASLPIIIAVFAVGTAIGLVALASRAATVADFTTPLMILVGLGVGIDYALLVFTRYRSELVAGSPRDRAVARALDTAGRTVFFAGSTVIVALLGLIVLGLGPLQGVAVAVALTVLVTMLAALTLLPALLAVFGSRIERRIRRRAARKTAAPAMADTVGRGRGAGRAEGEGRREGAGPVEGGRWWRWSMGVQRRPWIATVLPLMALVGLSVPLFDLRLGFADASTDSPRATSHKAYDLLSEGFGPGFNGPLIVVVEGGEQAAAAAREALAATNGVAAVQAAPTGGPAGEAADGPSGAAAAGAGTVVVVPESGPQAAETTELVERLREDVLPPVSAATGGTFLVGGSTAAVVDFSDAVAGRLPAFVGVVVGLSALLLLLVFRSLLIPLKAALLNLLSVGAAMGVVVLVFQHGLLGEQPGPVEAYVPVMIFAIVFGLSMDYEVFLLARMHEAWQRRPDPGAAVAEGMATTGRVVTAAAAIMVVVFGAFLLSPDRMLRQFGLGLATAVLLDAIVIRCLIVPAVMQLFGRAAWWLPAPLARRLPRVALE